MSTVLTWQTESSNLEATLKLASEVGSRIRGGETIVLQGDLGAGKTAFVQGLASGMGSSDRVRSPSFTISHQYSTDELTLHHFDFYRLEEPGILKEELEEVLKDDKAVVVVEWADIAAGILPSGRLTLQIQTTGDNHRRFRFEYPEKLKYLIPT